ncbi:MEDS domain-containing protein [Bradyrhizobium sp. 38]|nr:MEDS domain-containing protein [Bradyrhizobium sp. 38]MCK1779909.1 MEDS domain-containing protein [Bradyrhizobium sp. 132]
MGLASLPILANGDELRDAIVPYFKAGLENDERCLLVAMDPFGADDARSALRAAVGDFDRRELAKQIEIHDVRTWYAVAGAIESGRRPTACCVAKSRPAPADSRAFGPMAT